MRLILCCLLAFWCVPALAEPPCPTAAPTIIIQPLFGGVEINHAYNQQGLQGLAGLGASGHASRMPVALGLTLTQVMAETQIGTELHKNWQGEACASLTKLEVRFGFNTHTVYIPREFPAGSCAYNAIYGHEMKHVQVDRMLVSGELANLRQKITARMRGIKPARGGAADALTEALKRQVESAMTDIQKDFTRLRQQKQAAVDTPDEYRRVGQSCGGVMRAVQALRPPP